MTYNVRRVEQPNGCVRFLLVSGNPADPYTPPLGCIAITVERGFGGLSIDVIKRAKDGAEESAPLGYVYADQAAAMADAMRMIVEERAVLRRRMLEAERVRMQTCQLTAHMSYPVDLSCAATQDALAGVQARIASRVGGLGLLHYCEILYRGHWWELARTDLADDVCTGGGDDYGKGADQIVRDYAARARFGARLKHYPGGRRVFAVVDSLSDG